MPICLLYKVESCSVDNFTFVSIIIMALMSEPRAIVQAHYLCPSFRHATCFSADFAHALSHYIIAQDFTNDTRPN